MNITAQMVKELRDKTGAGMMDAKKLLLKRRRYGKSYGSTVKGMASADKKWAELLLKVLSLHLFRRLRAMVKLTVKQLRS
ncbi:MAG: hypothetical protein ACLSA2_10865 [Candidatus Gastranaerophilaceae bacterium]